MDNLNNYFNSFAIQFLNKWIDYVQTYWPYVGTIFGLLVLLAWVNRENKSCSFFCWLSVIVFLFQPGLYFSIPNLSNYLAGSEYYLPEIYLWSFFAEVVLDALIVWLGYRYFAPVIESIQSALTKRSTVERNRKTDIREINLYLPNSQKTYPPSKYFNERKGIFFGVNEQKRPVYVEWAKWSKSNIDIIGTPGSGKGVAAGILLTQALSSGECVIAVDPKNDEFLPHVLQKAALEAGVSYVYIDLQAAQPQWNPLLNKSAYEIEELLAAGFSLGERNSDSDFYRLDDRRAARTFAELAFTHQTSLIDTLKLLIEQQPDIAKEGKKFVSDLEEIGLLPAANIVNGVDLAQLMRDGAVIYVRGSMRNPRILKLQRIFVLSIIQLIESRDRESARQVCLFMDEFKYLISRPTLEMLGAIRDKRGHAIIAHQSIGDLRDCPTDLDPNSVVASINENCAIKLAYSVKDPDTAEWLSRMSGTILVDDEIRQVKTNIGLTETRDRERSLRQAERPLIDTNMLQALPDRCAAMFGAGLAKFIFTSPITVIKSTQATTPIEIEQPSQPADVGRKTNNASLTTAQSMLDVD